MDVIPDANSYANRLEGTFINIFSIDDIKYDLRSITSIECKDGEKCIRDIYSRYGNKQSSWRYQKCSSRSIQSRTSPSLKHDVRTITTYVKLKKVMLVHWTLNLWSTLEDSHIFSVRSIDYQWLCQLKGRRSANVEGRSTIVAPISIVNCVFASVVQTKKLILQFTL